MKTAILTDSASNLTKETISKYDNLFVVPLQISVDDKMYRDQVEISSKEIYEKIDTHTIKSSLPKPEDIHNTIEEIVEKGYNEILIITISSGLSGTYNAIRLAAQEFEQLQITIYDTKTLGMAQGLMVLEALEYTKSNLDIDIIIEKLDEFRFNDLSAFYTIETLKYLRAGGRIGKVEGTVADILRIKPIISVSDEGVYFTHSKVRGNKRALRKFADILVDKYKDTKINLVIQYGNDLKKAEKLLESLKEKLNINKSYFVELTPVLGIHTGPGLLAVMAHSA